MNFFDLHCDTLYEMSVHGKKLDEGSLHVSLQSAQGFSTWIQGFAIWIPDEMKKNEIGKYFDDCVSKFEKIKGLSKGTSLTPILTVEGGAALLGDLSRIDYLKEKGVKALTLTWNGPCELGDGVGVEKSRGLTEFGRRCVKRLEEEDIAVDISHASEKLFWQVVELSKKSVIATHSNSKKICSNKRNLSDEQFKAIIKSGGIVGINFCDEFLKDDGGATFDDVLKHVDHFLSIDGEDHLCIGSDFDGCTILKCMSGTESVGELFEFFLKHNYSESLLEKIFFKNAYNFFKFV